MATIELMMAYPPPKDLETFEKVHNEEHVLMAVAKLDGKIQGDKSMSRVRLGRALLLCATAVYASCSLYAQSDNGNIVGYVKDPTGAVIPKSKVTLRNEATG